MQKVEEEETYLSSCVGADIHPGLSSIEPEDACGPLGVVGQHDRDSAVKGHGVVKLVLEHIQVVEPIRITITETEGHLLRLDLMKTTLYVTEPLKYLHFVCEIQLVVDTHSVVLSLRVSACSGMP